MNDSPDDGPPQDILSALEALGAQLVAPKFNCGRSNARNLGASKSLTPYLEHVDGDDVPLPLNDSIIGLLEKDCADLIICPVVEWPVGTEMPEIRDDYCPQVQSMWAPLFSEYPAVDVRPAATIWRTASYQQLAGYDARFESGEDFQLAWRGLRSGLVMVHATAAKQIYHAKPKVWLQDPLFCEGHLAALKWLVAEGKLTRKQIEDWHPKLLTQNWWHLHRELFHEWKVLKIYLTRNLHKLRPW